MGIDVHRVSAVLIPIDESRVFFNNDDLAYDFLAEASHLLSEIQVLADHPSKDQAFWDELRTLFGSAEGSNGLFHAMQDLAKKPIDSPRIPEVLDVDDFEIFENYASLIDVAPWDPFWVSYLNAFSKASDRELPRFDGVTRYREAWSFRDGLSDTVRDDDPVYLAFDEESVFRTVLSDAGQFLEQLATTRLETTTWNSFSY